jgi:hypothetical protein
MVLACGMRESERRGARVASEDSGLAAEDADSYPGTGHDPDMTKPNAFLISLALMSCAPIAAAADDVAQGSRSSASYSAIRGHELMLNGFRAPSIGAEYRRGVISVHAGAYPTIVNDGGLRGAEGTTWFGKAGLTLWFLPLPMMGNERSSFYAGVSYLTDFGKAGWGHSAQVEAGFRWVVYQGLFVRLGASALYAPGRTCPNQDCQTLKVRPNPGIGLALPLD